MRKISNCNYCNLEKAPFAQNLIVIPEGKVCIDYDEDLNVFYLSVLIKNLLHFLNI